MALTPNYSFIIPTGTDAVNLLTQCYPNFSSLDNILKPIQESGVTVATDTKVGTVHQLVRTDSSCNMFRFIATANYASGDTFTVDGASVTATAMDGTALPAGAFVINQSVVCVLNNLVLTVMIAGKETTSIAASAVTYDNTISGLTATNAQDAIDELHDSANIAYDNTVSGLTAIDVQSAIDELASGPATDHGMYELWANPSPTSNFAAQSISFTLDTSEFDEIWIESAISASETSGVRPISFETSILSGTPFNANLSEMFIAGTILAQPTRSISISISGTTCTIAFSDTTYYRLTTYGQTPTSSTDNSLMIPARVLGLKHNS